MHHRTNSFQRGMTVQWVIAVLWNRHNSVVAAAFSWN